MVRAPHGSRGHGRGRGSSSAASSGATNFIRDHQKLIFGAEFMLHRHHVDNRWVACEPRDEGHEPDSGVHRYDRVHGFAVTDEELEMMRRDPVIAAAERRSRQADKQDVRVGVCPVLKEQSREEGIKLSRFSKIIPLWSPRHW